MLIGASYDAATTLTSSFAQPPNPVQVPTFPSSFQNPIILEMIQQMVISTLSALGLLSNPSIAHSSCILDSSSSNYMTYDPLLLSNFRSYIGPLNIHTIDGNTLWSTC